MENHTLKALQNVRLELQSLKIKPTGRNSYSNYDYYELSDILPHIQSLCQKEGIIALFSISPVSNNGEETATLIIRNVEKPEDEAVVFTSPTAEPEIGKKKDGSGGADPIQNLGGKITYMKRYMYMMAFEIYEQDTVEAYVKTRNNTENKSETPAINDEQISPAQVGMIGALINKELGMTNSDMGKMIEQLYGVKQLPALDKKQASDFIKRLQAKVKAEK